ncbi:MAG: M20/M25/M40 family metallo-hydrolase [Acidobacteria bacterium]|nr:M20/M25/M40 family metallo-hydrolase [Acidobacteriota bacterium]
MEIVELTRRLIDIPSVTGEESEAGRFISRLLEDLGYRVTLQDTGGGRVNVLGTTASPPLVMLTTHYDTVPPFMPSGEDGDYVYGRGACDAKGILAAQVLAAERLRADGINEVGLLFVVDEELGSHGARVANEHASAFQCRFLINGEPTENRLATGSKGSLRAVVSTEGRAAHSAYPEAGDSAIDRLLDILSDIRSYPWPEDAFFGRTTCNIGLIAGGTRPNIVPASASAEIHIRLVTGSSPIREILDEIVKGRGRVEVLSVTEPVRMVAVEGFEQCVVRFTTDIPHLSNWGEPLLLGPGSILDAHTAHERVSKRQLAEAVELYVSLVHKLLAKVKTNNEEAEDGGK